MADCLVAVCYDYSTKCSMNVALVCKTAQYVSIRYCMYTIKMRYSIVYNKKALHNYLHATENTVENRINANYARCKGIISSILQRLPCILIGCIVAGTGIQYHPIQCNKNKKITNLVKAMNE